ncbi:hypothetical protein [Flaviaesturariibacter terrae]
MRKLLPAILILAMITGCQKETTLQQAASRTSTAGDSTLLKQFVILQNGMPHGYGDLGDTLFLERFSYDSQRRIVQYDRYDSLYTGPWVHDRYYYQGNDSLPYKVTRREHYSDGGGVVLDTMFYRYDAAGRLIYDSLCSDHDIIGGSVSIRQQAMTITQSGAFVTLQNDIQDTYEFTAANGLLSQQRDTGNFYPAHRFQYDDHPNPLYRPELALIPDNRYYFRGVLVGGIDVKFRQRHNLTHYSTQYMAQPIWYDDVLAYTYRADGYPLSATMNVQSASRTYQLQYTY